MRILDGRHTSAPTTAIPGLTRIAVVGDSNVFGQGVAPDETLPAHLTRLLNEASPGGLFEAFNCGVSGYNLWNGWSHFKVLDSHARIFGAAVLVLCNNDAQMFGRTFRLAYPDTYRPWTPGEPIHAAVVACFNDIAAWRQARGIPFAVCYYTLWPAQAEATVTRMLAELCRERDIPFVDFYAYFTQRKLPSADLRATKADGHPSRLAHDAAARHLADTIRKLGWFDAARRQPIEEVFGEIRRITRGMDESGIPTDAALHWGLLATQAKSRSLTRAAETPPPGVMEAAAETRGWLEASYAVWSQCHRAAALAESLDTRSHGFLPLLWLADECGLRIEELSAVALGQDPATQAVLLKDLPNDALASRSGPSDALDCLALARQRLAAMRQLAIQDPEAAASMQGLGLARQELDRAMQQMAPHIEHLDGLIAYVEYHLTRVRARDQGPEPSGPAHRHIAAATLEAAQRIENATRYFEYLIHPRTQPPQFYTSVDVYLETAAVPDTRPFVLDVVVDYRSPHRIALKDGIYVLLDGQTTLARFRFPLFFSGRVSLTCEFEDTLGQRGERGSFLKVEIYNLPDHRMVLLPEDFHVDKDGNFIFPFVQVA